jgi:signal transduction histidine kinase
MRYLLRRRTDETGFPTAPSGSLVDSRTAVTHAGCIMTPRELVASIAHEVNQPLAAIVAHAESCLNWLGTDQPDMARIRGAAERIVQNGHRASAVLNNIRTLLRASSTVMSTIDLNELIQEIPDLMHIERSRRDVVLQLELCPHIGCIRGNRIQLLQVVLNLITNGIESMSDSGIRSPLVRVTTAVRDGSALVAVEDSGPGFDVGIAERMFEPFFTTKPAGTGVGLSICRSFVESHGGVLWAVHREPCGSVFQFTVPLVDDNGLLEN